MHAHVYEKGANGLPTTTLVADLAGRTLDLAFTHGAMWGPLTARVAFAGAADEGERYANQYLGNPVTIWSPAGEWLWEGLIWSVSFGEGRRRRTRSLEGYANLVRMLFENSTYVTDPPTSTSDSASTTADALGQATYGTIEHILEHAGIMTSATAAGIVAKALNIRKRLLWMPESGGDGITLECMGYWRTLQYDTYADLTTGTADIGTVIRAVLTASGAFISTDQGQVSTATGIFVGKYYNSFDVAGDIIKDLVSAADGYTFGLDRDRVPYLRANNRSAATATYTEDTDGTVRDASDNRVQPWLVRPDAVLRQAGGRHVPSAGTGVAVDDIDSFYLVETTYSMRGGLDYTTATVGVDGQIRP